MNKIFNNKELHLIIIWKNGRYKEQEIVKSVNEEFDLVEKYKINWDKNLFGKNLTTFYGTNLPPNSKKEKHCGNGEFLLLTFYDNYPKYDYVETSRGTEKVNLNVFLIKEKFRNWTGGGHKIHATNSINETNHDLILLLGLNYYDYKKSIKEKFNNINEDKNFIKYISSNVTGVDGWKSLDQLFYVMNGTVEYVILRNFENLPNNNFSKDHEDIDFLVRDIDQAVYVTNAEKLYKKRYKINVSGKDILIDFENVGDNYYDQRWQNHILKKKKLLNNCFYVPELEDYFYSLIYHVLFHKTYIATDYHNKINEIYKRLSIYDLDKCNFNNYLNLLENFLIENNYQLIRPKDPTVFFDEKMIDYKKDIEDLSIINCKNIEPFLINEWKNFSGYIYFKGEIDNKKIFIKSRGLADSVLREYKIIKELRFFKTKYFPKVYYSRYTKNQNFIVMEKIEGTRLDQLINSNELETKQKKFKENIYNGIFAILKILHNSKIVHRDVRPQNIIIKTDGTPILIDFQFAVDVKRKRFKEYKIVKKKPRLIKGLGSNYAKNTFHWDDAYSVKKILDSLKINDDQEFLKTKIEVSEIVGKYEIISIYNNFFSKIITLTKNYLSPQIYLMKFIFYKMLYAIFRKEYYKNKIKKFKNKYLYLNI